jgi:hypothetical protein
MHLVAGNGKRGASVAFLAGNDNGPETRGCPEKWESDLR